MKVALVLLALSPWGHALPSATGAAQHRQAPVEPSATAEPEPEPAEPTEPAEPPNEDAPREEAAQAFSAGVAAYKEGEYEAALRHFERAQALAPHPDTLFNIGHSQQQLGEHQAAWRTFTALLQQTDDEQERRDIETARAESRLKIAELRVVPAVPSVVCLDGEAIVADADGLHRTLTSPRPHHLQIGPHHRTVKLEPAETRVIETPPPMPPVAKPRTRRPLLRALAGVAIGTTAVGTGLAVGAGVADDRDLQLGFGVGSAGAGLVALTATIATLVVHRRQRKAAPPPAPIVPNTCVPAP